MGAREVPLGITMSTGTLVVVVCCAVPSAVTGPGVDARLGVLALGLAAFAASVVDLAAVAISVGVGFLLFDGFVEGDHGDLVWRGRTDLVRFGVLCLAGALGLLLGVLRRHRERRHAALAIPDGVAPAAPAVKAAELQALSVMPRQRSPQPSVSPRSPEAAGE